MTGLDRCALQYLDFRLQLDDFGSRLVSLAARGEPQFAAPIIAIERLSQAVLCLLQEVSQFPDFAVGVLERVVDVVPVEDVPDGFLILPVVHQRTSPHDGGAGEPSHSAKASDSTAALAHAKDSDVLDLRLVQLTGGHAGVSGIAVARLKKAATAVRVSWLVAMFDGEALQILPDRAD
jgi:hypothetical protein